MKVENLKHIPINRKSSNNSEKYIPDDYKKFAKAKERLFLELMLKEMQKSVPGSETPSSATQYYKDLLLSERAKTISNNDGGIGVQKVILNEIYPERLRSLANFNAYNKQKEAIARMYQKNNQNIEMKKNNEIRIHKSPQDGEQ